MKNKLKKYYRVFTFKEVDGEFDFEYHQYDVEAWSPESAIKKINHEVELEEGEVVNSVEYLGIPFKEILL